MDNKYDEDNQNYGSTSSPLPYLDSSGPCVKVEPVAGSTKLQFETHFNKNTVDEGVPRIPRFQDQATMSRELPTFQDPALSREPEVCDQQVALYMASSEPTAWGLKRRSRGRPTSTLAVSITCLEPGSANVGKICHRRLREMGLGIAPTEISVDGRRTSKIPLTWGAEDFRRHILYLYPRLTDFKFMKTDSTKTLIELPAYSYTPAKLKNELNRSALYILPVGQLRPLPSAGYSSQPDGIDVSATMPEPVGLEHMRSYESSQGRHVNGWDNLDVDQPASDVMCVDDQVNGGKTCSDSKDLEIQSAERRKRPAETDSRLQEADEITEQISHHSRAHQHFDINYESRDSSSSPSSINSLSSKAKHRKNSDVTDGVIELQKRLLHQQLHKVKLDEERIMLEKEKLNLEKRKLKLEIQILEKKLS